MPGTRDVRLRRGSLLEFTNRQIVITHVYEPRLWALGGLAHALYCGAVLTGIGMFFADLITGAPAIHLLLLAMVPPVLSMARGVLRLAAVMEFLAGVEVEIAGRRLDLDVPCRGRAIFVFVEYGGRDVHPPDSLARHPLSTSLRRGRRASSRADRGNDFSVASVFSVNSVFKLFTAKALNTENTEDTEKLGENHDLRLRNAIHLRQKRKVRRCGHEEQQGKTQPETDLHGERGRACQLHRFGRHGSSLLRECASPCDQPLLTAPDDAPDVEEQYGPQPAADRNAQRAVAHTRLRQ